MKKSKWLTPILIIIVFLLILFGFNKLFVEGIKSYQERAKENSIEKEKELAFLQEEKFEENDSPIKDIQVGNSYTAILKEDGSVWVTGQNISYVGENTKEGIKLTSFTKMNLEEIEQISVGDEFVIARTKKGDVYSWGANNYSSLGIEEASSKPYQVPRKVAISNIKKIYVFGSQVAALSNDGIAYYWGYATKDEGNKVIHTFEQKEVKEIFLVQHQYYFQTVENEIYGVGFDFDGITDQRNGWAVEPVFLDCQNVKEIVSYQGYENNEGTKKYLLKNDGTVWKLNAETKGELETKIEGLNNITAVYPYLSKNANNSAFLAVDQEKNLYAYNEQIGPLQGSPVTKNVRKLFFEGVEEVFVNQGRILLVKEDQSLWNLGDSLDDLKPREGGYFLNYFYGPEEVNVKNTKLVSIGENFILVVDQKNKLYRQGNNQKGQLGAGEKKGMQELMIISPHDVILDNGELVEIDPSLENLGD